MCFLIMIKNKFLARSTIYILTLSLLIGCHFNDSKMIKNTKLNDTLIKNVNIIDVENQTIIYNKQILIIDGVIQNINDNISQEISTQSSLNSLQVLDAKGGYLTPGLIDMHVHGYEKSAFELTLSHGVTHVRIMNGVSQHLNWRKQQKSGNWIASSLSVSTPIVRSHDSLLSWSTQEFSKVSDLVVKAKDDGYDLIKLYGSVSQKNLEAIAEQANKLNMPLAKHGPHPSDMNSWNTLSNFQSLEHVEDIYQGPLKHSQNKEKLEQTLLLLKKQQVAITPTLNIYWQLTQICQNKQKFLNSLPKHYVSKIVAWDDNKNQIQRWVNCHENMQTHNAKTFEFLSFITQQLKSKNIPILVGSDSGVLLSPHGLATHNEIQLLIDAGLTPFEALRSATILPAKALNQSNLIGQIKVGMTGNLILTKDNPLIKIASLKEPESILINGRLLNREAILKLREHAITEQSWFAELWVILTNY